MSSACLTPPSSQLDFKLKAFFPVPPAFTMPLTDMNLMEGEELLFKATVIGKPEPDVLWMKDGKPIKFSQRIIQSKDDANCHLLKITAAQTMDAGDYVIKASNSCGEVECSAKTLVKLTPAFDKNLADKTSVTGELCQFEVLASGIPHPTLLWYLNDVEIKFNDRIKLEVKEHLYILTLQNVVLADDGVISVVATNDAGSTKSSARHTVHG